LLDESDGSSPAPPATPSGAEVDPLLLATSQRMGRKQRKQLIQIGLILAGEGK
jgi:hypothetical protein